MADSPMEEYTCEPRARFDECGTIFALNPATGRIRFLKDSPHYKQLRSIYRGIGIDIDSIDTEEQYYEIFERHKQLVYDVVIAGAMARQSNSLDSRYLKAIVRGDMREADRLRALIKKRKVLGLRIARDPTEHK